MKKVTLGDCAPGDIVRMRPDTVPLKVHLHQSGQTRLILKNEGFGRGSNELVYLEKNTPCE